MNPYAAALPAASRPKVHRLPPRAVQSRRHKAMAAVLSYGNAAKLVFTASSVALVLLALFFSQFSPLKSGGETVSVRAIAVSDAMASASSAVPQSRSIVLTGQDGNKIVGHMAKLSPAQQSSTEPAIISEVDKRRGQELLSIVNQTN